MNKNKLTTAGATLTPASYVSPTAMVKEIHSEGVLCISANLFLRENAATFQDWEEDNTFQW